MGKRVKKREVMGIVAEYTDAAQWVWEVRNRHFSYIVGQPVIETLPDGSGGMICMAKTIDIAIAFTVGWTQQVLDVPVPVVIQGDQGPTMFDKLLPSDN